MKQAWYHCGHCGSLFESALGAVEDRLCSECGSKPVMGKRPVKEGEVSEWKREDSTFERRRDARKEGGKRTGRKMRRKNIMLRVVVIWLILMLPVVWIRSRAPRTDIMREAQSRDGKGNLAEGTMADERIALMIKALPDCHSALLGFLSGGTPEIRNQFVANPIDTAGKMADFYQNNPLPTIETKGLKRIGQEAIIIGDEWMIETRWQSEDGTVFDAVFRREGAAWKLDWEHFSQYGDCPWALFLAGQSAVEGEFRLLARNVAVGDQAERFGSRLRFVLMAPVIGKSGETGIESPELVVDRRSEDGLLLRAAFEARAEGKRVFGGMLEPLESDDVVRVRVRIKRGEFGGVESFSLEKVIACHWYGVDEVGFDIEELKEDLFGTD